jgi:hypothetical protein
MEKRLFNKIIKEQMRSYGFEKTGTQDYAKEAADSITKIIVRVPDDAHDFCVGIQFKDFEQEYCDYSGKFSKRCMAYGDLPRQLALFESAYNCSEERIVDMVKNVMNSIDVFLQKGKDAVYENINQWISTIVMDKKKENDIYAYFGMPLIDPYSDSYILKQVEEFYKHHGKSMMSLDEYYTHKEHYDKYAEHGCQIYIGKEFVTIAYKQ